ncbi:MAG: PAS domain S-box protein [Treponema sp.]|jgi:PAS domain S-box-containing protein|nr:PAS domain S-box protein [Treponema sp.]
MIDFFRRALDKFDKLDQDQRRELFISAVDEIKLFKNVLDSIDKGIIVCDEQHRLLMANKWAQRLIPMNYIEGAKLHTAITDDRIINAFRDIIINREKIVDKEMYYEHHGHNRLFSVNVVPLVQDKHVTGTLIYIDDITEKRKGQARLRRAENLASLTTLAAGVAHEIKNPLGSISIHLQLLKKTLAKKLNAAVNSEHDQYKEQMTDTSFNKYFDVINEEVERLNRIVVDFLFAVRPVNLELREGNINELLTQIMEFVRYEMEQSNIMCFLELDGDVPAILMDERYMKQAILNLVKNSQSAMPKGGIFTISTEYADNEIRISVNDTGEGISKDDIGKIFEPYFTTKDTGTGLGLTQVYKIIKEHNGEITVDSASGSGAEFKISLPSPQTDKRYLDFNGGTTQ